MIDRIKYRKNDIFRKSQIIYLSSKRYNFYQLQGICVPVTCNYNGNCFVVPYNETDAEAVCQCFPGWLGDRCNEGNVFHRVSSIHT